MDPLVDAGLVVIDGARLAVAERARPVLRVIAAGFDAYLKEPAGGLRHAVAV